MEIAARRRAPSRLLGFAGGHAKPAEIDASGRLLLPLPPREAPGKLRENVRAAEICVALVGNVLREIAKPLRRRQSKGRSSFAAQRSRRARPALNSFQNPELAYSLQISGAQARCLRVPGFTQEFVQNFRDLEDGAIVERFDIFA